MIIRIDGSSDVFLSTMCPSQSLLFFLLSPWSSIIFLARIVLFWFFLLHLIFGISSLSQIISYRTLWSIWFILILVLFLNINTILVLIFLCFIIISSILVLIVILIVIIFLISICWLIFLFIKFQFVYFKSICTWCSMIIFITSIQYGYKF